MKKIIFILAALLLTTPQSKADTKSEALIKEMGTKLAGYKNYKVEMNLMYSGLINPEKATLTVEGDKFRLETSGNEVFSDGKTIWQYTIDDNEIIIENADANEGDLLSNPIKVFSMGSTEFSSRYMTEKNVNGKKFDVVELTPLKGSIAYKVITTLDQDRLPTSIVISPANEEEISILILKITPNVAIDKNTFVLDKKKYPGVEISDFR